MLRIFFVALISVVLLAGGYWLSPGSLPSDPALLPPKSDSEVRKEYHNYSARPDIAIKLLQRTLEAEDAELSTYWWAKYKQAQLLEKENLERSCEVYKDLAVDKRFPLHVLAGLNQRRICKNPVDAEAEGEDTLELTPEAELKLAKAAGNNKKAVELLIRLSKSSRNYSEKVDLVLEALDLSKKHRLNSIKKVEARLYRLSPSRRPKPNRHLFPAVAEDFKKRRLFNEAKSFYQKVIWQKRFTVDQKIKAYKGLRHLHKLQLDRPASLQVTRDLEKYVYNKYKKNGFRRTECEVYSDVNIMLARTEWTEHHRSRGQKMLAKLIRLCERKTGMHEAHWILGRMAEETQDFKSAIDHYQKAKRGLSKQSAMYQRVLWDYAWSHYKAANFPEAEDAMQTLARQNDSGLDGERYSFWLGKALSAQGKVDEAKAQFEKLHKDSPLSYYGFLAQRELGQAFDKKTLLNQIAGSESRRTPLALLQNFDSIYFEWLVATDERSIAKDYLGSVVQNLNASAQKEDVSAWVYLLNQYARIESYTSVFEKIGALEARIRQQILQRHHHLIFPMPYHKAVLSSSARFGVSAEYIYAIMRQESAFDPKARSPMDAFGLMQLLPEVAQSSAQRHGILFNTEKDLFDPETSILIGTSHLKELLDRHNGKLVLAIASYNANEEAIQSWLKTRYRGNTLEFIEDIPYEETRTYIKLVLRNLYTYRLFQNDVPDSAFPEWTLALE